MSNLPFDLPHAGAEVTRPFPEMSVIATDNEDMPTPAQTSTSKSHKPPQLPKPAQPRH